MTKTERQLLSLLRAGLWGLAPESSLFEGDTDWAAIKKQADRQTVTAVVFDGMAMLPKELQPQQALKFAWYADVVRGEKMNEKLNVTLEKVAERYRQEGISPILLKGQGVGQYYRVPSHRTPGDIDFYFPKDYDRANGLAKQWGARFSEHDLEDQDYVPHIGFSLPNGVFIENHHEYAFFFSKNNAKAWSAFEQEVGLTSSEILSVGEVEIPLLSPTLNVMYVFQHLIRHFLSFGVGLRQVCDWCYLIQNFHDKVNKTAFLAALDTLDFRRSMTALLALCENDLGLGKGLLPLDTSSARTQKDAREMMSDILQTGNFGNDTFSMQQKDSLRLSVKLAAYYAVVTRFFRIYKFGKKEIWGAVRFFFSKNTRKIFPFFQKKWKKSDRK